MSPFPESCFCFDYVLHSLSYDRSCDLVNQWPVCINQNKQIFLNETKSGVEIWGYVISKYAGAMLFLTGKLNIKYGENPIPDFIKAFDSNR